MPPDSPAVIVARYLKANNFTESYEAFIQEANLPYDSGDALKGDLTLEILLEEKKTFDISVRFEKLGLEDESSGWTMPSPSQPLHVTSLPSASNILSVAFGREDSSDSLLASTADRLLNILNGKSGDLNTSHRGLHDSPILSTVSLRGGYLLTTSMSGQLHLINPDGEVTAKRRDHSKYVVKVVVSENQGETIVATAGWDSMICLYKFPASKAPRLEEPYASIPLSTKPEAMLFLKHPSSKLILLVSRTDSNFIFYYTVEDKPCLIGKQNLAPHSNAWVAFTPSAFEICPTDPALLAVATSSVPHMKVLLVRLLFPPWEGDAEAPVAVPLARSSLLDEATTNVTQASQARAALAVADREAAAIQIHCNTMAPQTPYSTPALAWRPDGSGVFVNGDDGAVRGIEVSTGKVVATLRSGHEPGSKVRCLCAGMVDGEEVMVSGGFDQRLIIWRKESKS